MTLLLILFTSVTSYVIDDICGPNEVFQDCLMKCPDIYCPTNDQEVGCDESQPCPSGCGCQKYYLRKSVNEYVCIHASQCPPINCTGPNEKWNPCTRTCFTESCRDRFQMLECPPPDPDYCKPQCVCRKGFYRNSYNICVSANMCFET